MQVQDLAHIMINGIMVCRALIAKGRSVEADLRLASMEKELRDGIQIIKNGGPP